MTHTNKARQKWTKTASLKAKGKRALCKYTHTSACIVIMQGRVQVHYAWSNIVQYSDSHWVHAVWIYNNNYKVLVSSCILQLSFELWFKVDSYTFTSEWIFLKVIQKSNCVLIVFISFCYSFCEVSDFIYILCTL